MSKTSIACIALCDKKILVAHRNPVGQMGDRWEFPGGKVDGMESDKEAIIREMNEEFGINVRVGEKIAEATFMHNGEQFLLHAYRIFVPHNGMTQKYLLTEHTEYKWISIDEVESLNFVDSDKLLYSSVKKYIQAELSK